MLKEVHQSPRIEVLESKDVRAVLVLMQEFSLVPIDINAVVHVPQYKPHVYEHEHHVGFPSYMEHAGSHHTQDFSGQTVAFLGVPPSVMNPMAGIVKKPGPEGIYDNVFAATVQAYFNSPLPTKSVWFNRTGWEKYPIFRPTGRTYGSWQEFWLSVDTTEPKQQNTMKDLPELSDDPVFPSMRNPEDIVYTFEKTAGTGQLHTIKWHNGSPVLSTQFTGSDDEVLLSGIKTRRPRGEKDAMVTLLSKATPENVSWGTFNLPAMVGKKSTDGVSSFYCNREGGDLYLPKSTNFDFLNGQFVPKKWFDYELRSAHIKGSFKVRITGRKSSLVIPIDLEIDDLPFIKWMQQWVYYLAVRISSTVEVETFPEGIEELVKEYQDFLFPRRRVHPLKRPKE